MWLLRTATLTLHYFVSPDQVKPGYVILSHVWDKDEQTFQDVRQIHARCEASGEDRRKAVSLKIRRFCEVAEEQGYAWAWVDTCCIDKTSSAELSEAINSMYRYYSLALVCFVYLDDVPTSSMHHHGTQTPKPGLSSFARSKWHSRGWTLQELIAPRTVLFLSDSWEFLGSKVEFADELKMITRIPAPVLTLEQSPAELSVACRMSWAAGRSTTRLEDQAYCLLGLFDINMPTLYGEGNKAFRRLQEEIMKHSPDTTLFAWGHSLSDYRTLSLFIPGSDESAGLFATSPLYFKDCSNIEYIPRRHLGDTGSGPVVLQVCG